MTSLSPFLDLTMVKISLQGKLIDSARDVLTGCVEGASRQYLQKCKKAGQKSAMLEKKWSHCFS